MNVGFVSLGCSKNLIDTEATIGLFKKHNFKIVNSPENADILVINTCGFIESAKEEAINTILEMAEYKKQKCKYLVVMGCLVQRYYEELKKALPEVDLFIKIDQYGDLWKIISGLENNAKEAIESDTKVAAQNKSYKSKIPKIPMLTQEEFMNRVVTTNKNYAYLKIAEGCSNMCTYCAIPYIRGLYVSRKMEDILEEAQMLVDNGAKEIILIAQDTSKYGIDLYGKPLLPELLQKISQIKGIKWIRFLYSYPEGISDSLITEVKNNPKIAKYFDIPIQHISDRILKKMNRKITKNEIIGLMKKIRNQIPDVVLRTTLMVGFPGETEEDFSELLEFVKQAKFDKLGAFMYSKEDGTPAASMPNQVHGNTKKSRYNRVMRVQQEISRENLKKRLGKIFDVIIEDISFDGKYYIGRTIENVPDIDGVVYIKNNADGEKARVNTFIKCKIVGIDDYDLIAEEIRK